MLAGNRNVNRTAMASSEDSTHRAADDAASFRAEVARGLASAEAGRVIAYEAVRRWILSWGTGKELEPPQCR